MRLASPGHAIFAATMIALGLMGLIGGDFSAVWGGVPQAMPARGLLAYAVALVSLAAGLGLLWRRLAASSALALLIVFLFWLVIFKGRFIILAPAQEVSYQSAGSSAVMAAAAWVLYHWFATNRHRRKLGFIAGDAGLRVGRALYGLALIAFGLSHFFYLDLTAPLVPAWLLWPTGWAWFTGAAYLAAGVAILVDLLAKLAAALVAVQIGLITLLVWAPIIAAGNVSAMHWQEAVFSWALTAAAWIVAESYKGAWLAARGAAPMTAGQASAAF